MSLDQSLAIVTKCLANTYFRFIFAFGSRGYGLPQQGKYGSMSRWVILCPQPGSKEC